MGPSDVEEGRMLEEMGKRVRKEIEDCCYQPVHLAICYSSVIKSFVHTQIDERV